MFDMGFTELMLISIVALIVIGPERLPGVARTAGKYFGRLKRFMTSVRHDVEQELRADELRQILAEQQKELNTLKDSINEAGRKTEQEIRAAGEGIDGESPGAAYASPAATEAAAEDTLDAYRDDPAASAAPAAGAGEGAAADAAGGEADSSSAKKDSASAEAEPRKAARDAGP